MSCSICGDEVAPRPDNQAFPFCSHRCQLVDLSRWLDGNYRVPDHEPVDIATLGDHDDP